MCDLPSCTVEAPPRHVVRWPAWVSVVHRACGLAFALALLPACAPTSSPPSAPPAVRADLVVVPDGQPDDASILVLRYQEWTADGQRVPDIELDHGHGPMDTDDDEEDVMVQALSNEEPLPPQAVDAEGDRVFVDMDALPQGRQTLHVSVVHDGLTSDELAVPIVDRRIASP